MSKNFEALYYFLDSYKRFLQGKDTICQINLTREQATEFVNEVDEVKQAMQRLEAIDNANPSEAMECLEEIGFVPLNECYGAPYQRIKGEYAEDYNTIEQALIKAQEKEKENEALKEIIKSLFDRGSPLHQYIDKDFGLAIEVDKGISIMHLGKFKQFDLDKKLKEILHNEQ